MKKKLLIALGIIILATSSSVFAKSPVTPEVADAINYYKAGNYTECYSRLYRYFTKDRSNALAYYYFAMSCSKLGKVDQARWNYGLAKNLSTPNSNLNKLAQKGILCIDEPEKCTGSMYSDEEEEFIRNSNGPGMSKSVTGEYEKFKIENMMRKMNRSSDIEPHEFDGYTDFSTMNIQETPTNDEIVAALRTLQRAGLTGTYGLSDLSAFSGNSQQSQLMNLLGGSSANQQLIQTLLTNNMTLGF